jgi:hypothetical protein
MTDRMDCAFHKLIAQGMYGPIFVIGLVMRGLRGGMRQDELDFAIGTELKRLRD